MKVVFYPTPYSLLPIADGQSVQVGRPAHTAALPNHALEAPSSPRSQRQFKHLDKPGVVTVPGKLSDDLAPGTLSSIWRQARLEVEEIKEMIQEAIEFHIEGMLKEGLPIPKPTSVAHEVEVLSK